MTSKCFYQNTCKSEIRYADILAFCGDNKIDIKDVYIGANSYNGEDHYISFRAWREMTPEEEVEENRLQKIKDEQYQQRVVEEIKKKVKDLEDLQARHPEVDLGKMIKHYKCGKPHSECDCASINHP